MLNDGIQVIQVIRLGSTDQLDSHGSSLTQLKMPTAGAREHKREGSRGTLPRLVITEQRRGAAAP